MSASLCPVTNESWYFESAYEAELYEEIARESGASFRAIHDLAWTQVLSPIRDAPIDVCFELQARLEQAQKDSKTLDDEERLGRKVPIEHAFRIWMRNHEALVYRRDHETDPAKREEITAMLKDREAAMSALLNRTKKGS